MKLFYLAMLLVVPVLPHLVVMIMEKMQGFETAVEEEYDYK